MWFNGQTFNSIKLNIQSNGKHFESCPVIICVSKRLLNGNVSDCNRKKIEMTKVITAPLISLIYLFCGGPSKGRAVCDEDFNVVMIVVIITVNLPTNITEKSVLNCRDPH